MIRVIIGESDHEYSSANEHWINQQINRHKANGESVCVKVLIQENNIDIGLVQGEEALSKPTRMNRKL